jgi:hypothetical protein
MNTQQLPHNHSIGSHPKDFGNLAVDPREFQAQQRQGLALYVERFAFFFRAEFFCKRAFEILNSEVKPEHAGFRIASETLYRKYRTEVLLLRARGVASDDGDEVPPAETLVEHCYTDEYFTELDIERVQLFFAWLGVVRAPEPQPEPEPEESVVATVAAVVGEDLVVPPELATGVSTAAAVPIMETACPICFEEPTDGALVLLQHVSNVAWSSSSSRKEHAALLLGDHSQHKMCRGCLDQHVARSARVGATALCPFCKMPIEPPGAVTGESGVAASGLMRQLSGGYERAAQEEAAAAQHEEQAATAAWRAEQDDTARMLIEAMGGDAKQCPACGIVLQKADGDDTVMCGCEARPAGGNIEKALRGGGCGHEFKYSTGEPLGQGSPGRPFNERQWKFQRTLI